MHQKRADGDKNKTIPIIAMTAHVLDEVKEESSEVGINDYIIKPIRIEDLGPLIKRVLKNNKK